MAEFIERSIPFKTKTLLLLFVEFIQNTTIEERVSLLEVQVVEIEEDVTGLDLNVNFLFDEQVIQDERLFSLEQDTDVIISELDIVEDDLESKSFITSSVSLHKVGLHVCIFFFKYSVQIYRTQLLPWISESLFWRKTEGMMGTAQWLN